MGLPSRKSKRYLQDRTLAQLTRPISFFGVGRFENVPSGSLGAAVGEGTLDFLM